MNRKEISYTTLAVFVLMNFVLAMSASIFNGILDQVAIEMNVSIAETGLLNSFYAYGAGIGVPILLVLFRKIERTKVLKSMLLVTIIASLGTIYSQSFVQLLITRFIAGITGNSYGVLATATVVAFSAKERTGRALSLLIMGASLALVAGVPLTRILSQILNWESIFLILSVIMLFSLVYFMLYLPKTTQENSNINFKKELELFRSRETVLVIVSSFLTFLGYGAFFTYSTPYLLELFSSLEPIMSLLLVIIGLASFVGNLFGGVMSDRLGYTKSLILGSGVQVILAMLIFTTQTIKWLNVVLVVLWVMNGWFIGLQLNTGITSSTENKSSFMLSINGSGIQLGTAIGSSLAAIIITAAGIRYIIVISFVTAIAVTVLQGFGSKKAGSV